MNECEIRVSYDVACSSWVVVFGPITEWEGMPTGTYATQGRTLHEALLAAHDLLHGLVEACRKEGMEIPDNYPLKAQALERFLAELESHQEARA
jgi:predicted RNase H-like HicB family nuclease